MVKMVSNALARTLSVSVQCAVLLLAACFIQSVKCSVKSASLDGHNRHRKAAGLQELSWDSSLASSASQVAQQLSSSCSLQHSQKSQQNPVGENLYMFGGKSMDEDEVAKRGCKSWHAEVKDYQFPGGDQSFDACGTFSAVGHLTQMMWEKTTKMGCAVAKCSNGYVYVCHYSPSGNYKGQPLFKDDNFQSVCTKESGWKSCGRTQCGKRSTKDSSAIKIASGLALQLVLSCAAMMWQ